MVVLFPMTSQDLPLHSAAQTRCFGSSSEGRTHLLISLVSLSESVNALTAGLLTAAAVFCPHSSHGLNTFTLFCCL